MIEEHLHLPAGDDPPAAEADFKLTFPVKEYGFDYVGLRYIADGTTREAILLTPDEFQRVSKMFLRFDEKMKTENE